MNLADVNRRVFGPHHHMLVTAPVFIIAVVIVRYLRDPLERRWPDEGKARDLEERLGRLVDGERGQQARQ